MHSEFQTIHMISGTEGMLVCCIYALRLTIVMVTLFMTVLFAQGHTDMQYFICTNLLPCLGESAVHFSASVAKINRMNKIQERIILITGM